MDRIHLLHIWLLAFQSMGSMEKAVKGNHSSTVTPYVLLLVLWNCVDGAGSGIGFDLGLVSFEPVKLGNGPRPKQPLLTHLHEEVRESAPVLLS